jgi:nucleoside-diphosphate-sugar epimerase
MRVLVTGHRGYIGTVMTPMLIEAGDDVVGMDSDLYERCTFGDEPAEIPTRKKDIRDVEPSDFDGVEAVIHLAALSNDPLGDLNPDITFEINHRASVKVAEAAKEAGVERFLFSSSCSTYGAAGDEMIDETGEFNPVTPYGRSKLLVEQDVTKMADSSFSPIFFRSATAYGVSPRLRFDLVVNNLVGWAVTTGRVHLKSDGTAWRPLVHIEDISRAFIAALHAPRDAVHNQAFNVGRTEENYRVRDIATIIEQVVPDCEVAFAEGAGADTRCYKVNFDKIAETLPEFKPQWTVRKGAEQLYDAYTRIGLELDEFEGPHYKRLAHIKQQINDGRLDENLRWI